MASTITSFDTQHEDIIHDAQMDYYGKRIATCSSDRTIRIFEAGESGALLAELRGHEGPVWQVAWAHPKFGSIIASCSYDRKVFIWKETGTNTWSKIYDYDKHESSVNSIAFAPHEFGLILACGSSDGSITILTYKGDNAWDSTKIPNAHAIGVNSVSWAPAVAPGSLVSASSNAAAPIKRIVSGGCDNHVKIWKQDADNKWSIDSQLEQVHSDWVRDVAWAPNIGLPSSTIASCSQDGTVVIWTQESNGNWSKKVLPKFPDVVWRVSWSISGNILAVAGGDNKVTLWKESLDGEWKCISALTEEGESTATNS